MKRKNAGIIMLAALLAINLTGCGCKHETWNEADCTTPKTCADCGETEGEALGHTWEEASCKAPRTCTVCGETEGEALDHTWKDATCEAPKTCEGCGKTEGEALGHDWTEATCTTVAKCNTCGETKSGLAAHSTDSGKCTECGTYTLTNAFIPSVNEAAAYSVYGEETSNDLILGEKTFEGDTFTVQSEPIASKQIDNCYTLVYLQYDDIGSGLFSGMEVYYMPLDGTSVEELKNAIWEEFKLRNNLTGTFSGDSWVNSTGNLYVRIDVLDSMVGLDMSFIY